MRQWVGSLLFTTWLFVSVAVYGLAVFIFVCPFGQRRVYAAARLWVRASLSLLAVCCRLTHQVKGLERLPAENTVILMKHSSAWETLAQFLLFPKQTWVVKRELMWAPVLGWVLYFLDPIAINRSAGRVAVEQVIEQGCQRLQQGLWVMIFPEGTRVPAGQTRRFGLSGALLALAAGRPVVPVAHNAGEFWPRRGLLKRPGRITVAVGEPIPTAGRDARDIMNEAQSWIESELAAIRTAQ